MKIRSMFFALLLIGIGACNAFSRGSGISQQNGPTVLVGHSYGGAVITEACTVPVD